jgi:hypothetical protein
MNPLLRAIDQSPLLGKILSAISSGLALQRGLPMVVGTVFIILSLLTSAIILPLIVSSEAVADIWLLLCLPLFLLHIGILSALIGLMLSAPLGRAYRE